jgi:hypothetical protein
MRLLGFDTETYLIQTTEKAPKPVCCSWFDSQSAWLTHPGDVSTAAAFADPSNLFVGQNIAYDLVLMMRWHPDLIPDIMRALDEGRVFDTAMRERMLHLAQHGGRGFDMFPSLADMALKYLKLDLSAEKKGDDIWRMKYGTLDGVPFRDWPEAARKYALDDAIHTYQVFQAQGGLSAMQPTEQMQVQAAVVLQGIGVWGFAVNQGKRNVIKDKLEAKAKALHAEVDKFGWTGEGSQSRLMKLVSSAWNYKHILHLQARCQATGIYIDPAQVQQFLGETMLRDALETSANTGSVIPGISFPPTVPIKEWCKETLKGIPEIPMTKKGPSIAGEVLEQLGDVVPQFATYSDLRHIEKMLENYISPYDTDTVHSSFVPLVSTGRTGSRKPNTQNIPRKDKDRPDEAFRTMFMARKGRVLGTVDYSQLELCTLAATIRTMFPSVQCTLGDAIDAGKDVHCITGGLIGGMSYEQMIAGKESKDETVLRFRQGAKACFTGDTELLTPQGWRRIDSLHGNMLVDVVQYNPHDKSMGFVKPIAWVTKYDTVVTLKTTHMDQAVTPDHRLLFASRCGVIREVLAGDMKNLEIGGNNWSSVHGGFLQSNVTPVSDLCTRLSVMVQADGNFNGNKVRLGFTKARKINRCRILLKAAKLHYNESTTSQGATVFTIEKGSWYLLTNDKTFVSDWTVYDREAFCDELFRWDGHTAKKHHTSYGSTFRHNVDVAQAILSTNGYKTCYHNTQVAGKADYHQVEWYIGDRKKNTAYHRFGECAMEDGLPQQVYCLAVPSSWVLTRRNGRVVVSGNCNFGLPGGLGGGAFVGYAKNNYNVQLSLNQAWKYINSWKRAWPEVPNHYLRYSADMVDKSPTNTFTSYTITGRPKANCIYTEGSNYPFQGLAADGAKAALWAIWRECILGWYWNTHAGSGYGHVLKDSPLRDSRLVNFVHDEIVAEHLEGDASKAALKRQEALMISEMTRICQNKIKISVEGKISDAWEH